MTFLARRLKSISFWILCACILYWNFYQQEVISEHIKQDATNVANARAKITGGYYNATSKCNDGWASFSEGQGSCSWHDGVDYSYYTKKENAHITARIDLDERKQSYESRLEAQLIFYFVIAFLFSPLLDSFVLQGKDLFFSPSDGSDKYRRLHSRPPSQSGSQPKGHAESKPNAALRCTKCGAEMRIRLPKRGRHKGKPFLGCVRYPVCRSVRPLSQ